MAKTEPRDDDLTHGHVTWLRLCRSCGMTYNDMLGLIEWQAKRRSERFDYLTARIYVLTRTVDELQALRTMMALSGDG